MQEKFLSFYKLMSGFNEDDQRNIFWEEEASEVSKLAEDTRKAVVNFLVAVLKPLENRNREGIAKKAAEINLARKALKTLLNDSKNKEKYEDLMRGDQHKNAKWFYDSLQTIANLSSTSGSNAKNQEQEWIKEIRTQFQQQMPNQPVTTETVKKFLDAQVKPKEKVEVESSKRQRGGEQQLQISGFSKLSSERFSSGVGTYEVQDIEDPYFYLEKNKNKPETEEIREYLEQVVKNLHNNILPSQRLCYFSGLQQIKIIAIPDTAMEQKREMAMYALLLGAIYQKEVRTEDELIKKCIYLFLSKRKLFEADEKINQIRKTRSSEAELSEEDRQILAEYVIRYFGKTIGTAKQILISKNNREQAQAAKVENVIKRRFSILQDPYPYLQENKNNPHIQKLQCEFEKLQKELKEKKLPSHRFNCDSDTGKREMLSIENESIETKREVAMYFLLLSRIYGGFVNPEKGIFPDILLLYRENELLFGKNEKIYEIIAKGNEEYSEENILNKFMKDNFRLSWEKSEEVYRDRKRNLGNFPNSTSQESLYSQNFNLSENSFSWIANSGGKSSTEKLNIEKFLEALFEDVSLERDSIKVERNDSQLTITICEEEEGNPLFEKIQNFANKFSEKLLIKNLICDEKNQSLQFDCSTIQIAEAIENTLTEKANISGLTQ